jgi:hypothetical protein
MTVVRFLVRTSLFGTGFRRHWEKSRDSSVGIALGYGLDFRSSRVRFPAGTGNFSLHNHLQNGSGAHPASYPMGKRGFFPGGKAVGAWSWPFTSIWCLGQRMRGAIPPLPQYIFTAWCLVKHRDNFTFHLYWDSPSLLSNGYPARGWSCLFSSTQSRGFECVELYLHNPCSNFMAQYTVTKSILPFYHLRLGSPLSQPRFLVTNPNLKLQLALPITACLIYSKLPFISWSHLLYPGHALATRNPVNL